MCVFLEVGIEFINVYNSGREAEVAVAALVANKELPW